MTKTIPLVSAILCFAMTYANALEIFRVHVYAAQQTYDARLTSYSSSALNVNQQSAQVYRCFGNIIHDRKGFRNSGVTCNMLKFTGDGPSAPGKYEFFGAPQRQSNASGRDADSHTSYWLVNQDSGEAYFCALVPPEPRRDAHCHTIKLDW
jgi:hypothetical protein